MGPEINRIERKDAKRGMMGRTDNHHGELEALSHALTVDLIGKIGKPDVSHEFLADDGSDTVHSVREGGT